MDIVSSSKTGSSQGSATKNEHLEELRYAHETVLSHIPYGNTWAFGGSLPGPRAQDRQDEEPRHTRRSDADSNGAMRSLPRPPGLLKGDDRTLGIAMNNVYRQILYSRAMYLRNLLSIDDYTFSNPASCRTSSAPIDLGPLIDSGSDEHMFENAPLMFNDLVLTNKDNRAPSQRGPVFETDTVGEAVAYTSLKVPGSIRLLALLPGERDSELRGELVITYLPTQTPGKPDSSKTASETAHATEGAFTNSLQAYEALSYVWGSTTQNESITISLIGEKRLTDNLASALRRLRSQQYARILWIDALCIDQSDLDERSQQVQLMGAIYRNAARVLIWLGDAEVPRHVPMQSYLFQYEYYVTLWHGHNQLIERNPLDEEQDWKVRTLVAVVQQSTSSFWWQRAWIVQEFALAQFSPVVCFGDIETSWMETRLLVETVAGAGVKIGWPALTAILRFNEFSSSSRDIMSQIAKGELDLYRAVFLTRVAKATDPRDRLYALLSLVNRGGLVRKIIPDYTKPCPVVFAEATARLMEEEASLDYLFIVTGPKEGESRMEGLPTWTIDFTFGDRYSKVGADRNMPLMKRTDEHWFKPRPWKTSFTFDSSHQSLCCTGIAFDTIEKLYRLPKDKYGCRYPDAPFSQAVTDLHALTETLQLKDPYSQHTASSASTSRTASWQASDSLQSQDWSILDVPNASHAYPRKNDILDIIRYMLNLWTKSFGPPSAPEFKTNSPSIQSSRPHARDIFDNWHFYAQFFRGESVLFTTAKGFVGLAAASVGVGDLVALLLDCKGPVILRKSEERFAFRGLAYLHGAMEGEVVERMPKISERTMEFVIG